jgi:SAM-dependent methyltransferase
MIEAAGYIKGDDQIFRPCLSVLHRGDEYNEGGFETLAEMQDRHFWYQGRHRFLLHAVDRYVIAKGVELTAIDLGGGVGGWVRDLARSRPKLFKTLALADSSLVALNWAKSILPSNVERYQIDLMDLQMDECWDAAFLLDVIEHLPDDLGAMIQAKNALKKGGLLFVTTPAFPCFWSYNDDLAHHLRRYRKRDFKRLADDAGLKLVDARYFMFFLSPAYLVSRLKPGIRNLSDEQRKELAARQHAVPRGILNEVLASIFNAETPIGHWVSFPWGTSILGVFEKTQ